MKIKRRDAQGNTIIVDVPDGYVLLEGEEAVVGDGTQQVAVQAVNPPTEPEVDNEKLLNKIRSEEKAKHKAAIEREKQERIRLQDEQSKLKSRLEEMEAANREAELEALKPSERQAVEFRELQNRLEEERRTSTEATKRLQAQLRATELTAYRERAIRGHAGQLIAEMVAGSSEEDIDASVERARQAFSELQQSIRQSLQAEYEARLQGSQSSVPQASIPQNPAYIPPPAASAGPPQFPTVAAPQPVAEAMPSAIQLSELTSEEAVRSGRYGGELRQQILAQLQHGQAGAQLGSSPRHLATPAPATAMPLGVMQPQGTPMGAVANPNMVQQPYVQPPPPQAQPQVPQSQYLPQQVQPAPQQPPQHAPQQAPQPGQMPMTDPVAQAQAAVARTHAGQNPVMAANPGAQTALATAQNVAQGQSPGELFSTRFANSPPVNG